MKLLLQLCLTAAALLATTVAKPTNTAESAVVEIEKQRLVKFPDDIERQPINDDDDTNQTDKHADEAKRILGEIAKINEALGYVKKPVESAKRISILDSSQYLFPKPAYHPFHAQTHQTQGRNGGTILLPSIRSVNFEDNAQKLTTTNADEKGTIAAYNVPPKIEKLQNEKGTELEVEVQPQEMKLSQLRTPSVQSPQQVGATVQTSQKPHQLHKVQHHYYFRPDQVFVPSPENRNEQQQLPTHFAIPVRLYRLNKQEYLQKYAPEEYRVKGYKIVGDVDNFYGKTKPSHKSKSKSTPKYHLFFLPREVALNENSARAATTTTSTTSTTSKTTKMPQKTAPTAALSGTNSREEKLAPLRPLKIQASSSSSNTNKEGTTIASNSTTQIIRKRIVPKPLRPTEPQVVETVYTQEKPTVSSSSIRITPPPIALTTQEQPVLQNAHSIEQPILPSQNNNNNNQNFFNSAFNNNNNGTGASNAIKTAFQNIFRFPFRPDARPIVPLAADRPILQAVPLIAHTEMPPKTIFAAQPQMPNPFFQLQPQPAQSQYQQNQYQNSNPNPINYNNDYKWEDESASNSANEEDMDDASPEQAEKHLFAHQHQQHQKHQASTQQQALRQGGIIIQRLKVRKGGIAIAGPGGVATAGSGGTAIVGPNGYALTHPRSLTIAGPGAKIIAIPANVDLKDALNRTDLKAKSFPREGKIVATGPTVYYSPATGLDSAALL